MLDLKSMVPTAAVPGVPRLLAGVPPLTLLSEATRNDPAFTVVGPV